MGRNKRSQNITTLEIPESNQITIEQLTDCCKSSEYIQSHEDNNYKLFYPPQRK